MVNSVKRAVAILSLLGKEGRLSLTQICKTLHIPKSTTFSILETLEVERLIEKDEPTGTFSLGVRLLELGQEAQKNFELRKVASPYLQHLNYVLDETVHLTVLDDDEVLYVECFESSKRLRTYSVIGVRGPLHCTAVGKAILAFLDDDQKIRLVNKLTLERFTKTTITDKKSLLEDLERVRKRGYSVDNVEHEEGVRCVGVPVYDNKGRVCASISGPTQRITEEKVEDLARHAKDCALDISKRLGYREP